MKKIILSGLALCFAALLIYSGRQAWRAYGDYRAEAELHGAVMEYKPAGEEAVDQGVAGLRAEYPDAVGWLTVPGTRIDYPFVQARDNDYYLRRDLDGNDAMAGTLFLDCRCDISASPNLIIYGHNMKNGSMFGTLKSFADKAFFEANTYGTIYLPEGTLRLEFFAYLVVQATDEAVYGVERGEGYLDYVRGSARQYRDIGLAGGDRVVTLSTCSYEFNNARMVLLAKAA